MENYTDTLRFTQSQKKNLDYICIKISGHKIKV